MKKSSFHGSKGGSAKILNLKKPFDFCCDYKNQDAQTRYFQRNPPFESSMENIFLNGGGPDLKVRIQDTSKSKVHNRKSSVRIKVKVVERTSLGDCKRCRGPLRWYIEDEISTARNDLVRQRRMKHDSDVAKNIAIALKKERKRRAHRKKGKDTANISERDDDKIASDVRYNHGGTILRFGNRPTMSR